MPSWIPFVGTILFSLISALVGAAITITRLGARIEAGLALLRSQLEGRLDMLTYRLEKLEKFQEEARPAVHWARNRMVDDNFMPTQIVRLVECIDALSAHVKKLDAQE